MILDELVFLMIGLGIGRGSGRPATLPQQGICLVVQLLFVFSARWAFRDAGALTIMALASAFCSISESASETWLGFQEQFCNLYVMRVSAGGRDGTPRVKGLA